MYFKISESLTLWLTNYERTVVSDYIKWINLLYTRSKTFNGTCLQNWKWDTYVTFVHMLLLKFSMFNEDAHLSFNKAAGSLLSCHFYLYSYRRLFTHNQVCGTFNIQLFLIMYGTVFVLKLQCLLGEELNLIIFHEGYSQ